MTAPHHLDAPDGSFTIGDNWAFGQAFDVDVVDLLTMGGIIPDVNNIEGTIRTWLGYLPLPVLQIMFRPLIPKSTDADWQDTPTAVDTIMHSMPFQTFFKFIDWIDKVFAPFRELFDKLVGILTGVITNPGGILAGVASAYKAIVDTIKAVIAAFSGLFGGSGDSDLLGMVKAVGDWLNSINPFRDGWPGLVKIVADVIQKVQDFFDGIWKLFTGGWGGGKTLAETLAAIDKWLKAIFKPVSDGLSAVVKIVQDVIKRVQDFFDGIWNLFTGNAGTGKSLAETLAGIANWLKSIFKPVSDGFTAITTTVQAVLKKLQDFFDGIWNLFTGSGGTGKTLDETLAGIANWLKTIFKPLSDGLTTITTTVQAVLKKIQDFFDGIWRLFSGSTKGDGKTLAETLTSIDDWLKNFWQKLVDGILGLAKLIPGFAPGANAIQNVVDIIADILNIGQSAAESAANAQMGVAAIEAIQAGGGKDEFDYPKTSALPRPWTMEYSSTGGAMWGPDGAGRVAIGSQGNTLIAAEMHARLDSPPRLTPDVTVTIVVSKPPHKDSIFVIPPVNSYFWIEAQRSLTDKSCIRVKIGKTTAQFEKVNAAGTPTNVGSALTTPAVVAGDAFKLEIKGTKATLVKNNITQGSVNITPLAGRCVGFGATDPTYVWPLGGHPLVEFAGIAWN